MRLDLGRRLPGDGQRHLRCSAKGGDVAIGQPVGVVLAAVLDLEVQPRAPALGAHFAAVGFAGQVHPGAGAVLDPIAGDAGGRVHIQAEALGAAAFGQADPELRQTERHFHALGQAGASLGTSSVGGASVRGTSVPSWLPATRVRARVEATAICWLSLIPSPLPSPARPAEPSGRSRPGVCSSRSLDRPSRSESSASGAFDPYDASGAEGDGITLVTGLAAKLAASLPVPASCTACGSSPVPGSL